MPNVASSDVRVDDVIPPVRRYLPVLAFALAGLFAASRSAGAQSALPTWMAGCWERRTPTTIISEQWSRPRAGMMLGSGQTTRGDSTIEFEHTRIIRRGGALVYSAQPSGQTSTEFVADSPSDTLIVFENAAHDFPQRVIYRRRGGDSLFARIEGSRGGTTRGIDFRYGRVTCSLP